MPDDVTGTLATVAAGLPGGGESRQGQQTMAEAVGRAIADRRHLVVQAGTGTGKSLAYLIPAALSGQRVVVATATKALQDQLAHNDLPLVAAAVSGSSASGGSADPGWRVICSPRPPISATRCRQR